MWLASRKTPQWDKLEMQASTPEVREPNLPWQSHSLQHHRELALRRQAWAPCAIGQVFVGPATCPGPGPPVPLGHHVVAYTFGPTHTVLMQPMVRVNNAPAEMRAKLHVRNVNYCCSTASALSHPHLLNTSFARVWRVGLSLFPATSAAFVINASMLRRSTPSGLLPLCTS